MASVEKRPDGRWRARWREYPGGPQATKSFVRKGDADRFLTEVSHDLLAGSYIDPAKGRTTVREFYTVWAARQPWRASSRASVESLFVNHVLPAFGDRPLGTIRRGDIESWAAKLNLSARTAGQAVQYLGTMFESAVADGLVATNPAHDAKRPKVVTTPIVPFTADEVGRLHEASPPWFDAALTLGAVCGLRQGDATGLTADRVNFLKRTLTVDRQLGLTGGFAPLKTAKSYRAVPLADVALTALARHLETYGTGTDGLVLHDREGDPIGRGRFGYVWRSLRTRAGMPTARFHDLRHTYASVLLSGGVPVPAAADYLGHSPAILLGTYAHLIPADHDRARAVVQAAFAAAGRSGAGPAEDSLRTKGLAIAE